MNTAPGAVFINITLSLAYAVTMGYDLFTQFFKIPIHERYFKH